MIIDMRHLELDDVHISKMYYVFFSLDQFVIRLKCYVFEFHE